MCISNNSKLYTVAINLVNALSQLHSETPNVQNVLLVNGLFRLLFVRNDDRTNHRAAHSDLVEYWVHSEKHVRRRVSRPADSAKWQLHSEIPVLTTSQVSLHKFDWFISGNLENWQFLNALILFSTKYFRSIGNVRIRAEKRC